MARGRKRTPTGADNPRPLGGYLAGALGEAHPIDRRTVDEFDRPLVEPPRGMQGDVIGAAAQALLAQRRSGILQIDVGAENTHRRIGVVRAERLRGRHPGRPAADNDHSGLAHHRVTPALGGLDTAASVRPAFYPTPGGYVRCT